MVGAGIGGRGVEAGIEGGEVGASDGLKIAMRGGAIGGIGLGREAERGTRDDDLTNDGDRTRRIGTREGGGREAIRLHVDGGMTQGTGSMIDGAEIPNP